MATLGRVGRQRRELDGTGSASLFLVLCRGRVAGDLLGLPHRAALHSWLPCVFPVAVAAYVDWFFLLLAQDSIGALHETSACLVGAGESANNLIVTIAD